MSTSSLSLVFAFCCLFCAALNDMVFKLFARKARTRGLFFAVIGVVCTVGLATLPDQFGDNWKITLLYGTISGVLSVVSNMILLEVLTKLSVGLCSTVFRMNMAVSVVLASLLLHEHLTSERWLGVFFAIFAVLLFVPSTKKIRKETNSLNPQHGIAKKSLKDFSVVWSFLFLLLAMCLRGAMDIASKLGFQAGAAMNGIGTIRGVFWIIGGLLYYFYRENEHGIRESLSWKIVGYGVLDGFLAMGITFFGLRAVKYGDASIVLPIEQMSFLLTFILSVIFLREQLTVKRGFAILCGIIALFLLSR